MKIQTIIAMMAMMAISSVALAQTETRMSNEALSSQYKMKTDAVKMEVKALEAKKKANPNDIQVVRDLGAKKAELKDLQVRKKVIDAAAKSDREKDKAERAAAKAAEKVVKLEAQLKKAQTAAEAAKDKADKAARKAMEKTAKVSIIEE